MESKHLLILGVLSIVAISAVAFYQINRGKQITLTSPFLKLNA